MLELSTDQSNALKQLLEWSKFKNKTQFITLGGYAGTGKTTLISVLRNELNEINKDLSVAFCSYTGKASRVLKSKITESKAKYPQDSISTIHSLIYSPVTNDQEEIVGWEPKKKIDADLVIIDEASMIDQDIWRDLLSYNIPIIAVGDHGQLPPIRGSFNLMEEPQIKLEEIHRQAKDNPIIKLSIEARTKGEITKGKYGAKVMKLQRGESDSQEVIGELLQYYKKDTLVLCGYNTTRVKMNKYIRQNLEFESDEPKTKDRVICLRNNHQKDVYNGMLGTITSISRPDEDWYDAVITMDEEDNIFKGLISTKQFNEINSINFTKDRSKVMRGDLFDFGYALTVHKAQGSQSRKVVLFEERFKQMDDETWRRWLYTAVTRAEEELYIVGQ